MKLVTDGEKWAIKKWSWVWFGYVFYDIECNKGFWWGKDIEYFEHCWTDKEHAERIFRRLKA